MSVIYEEESDTWIYRASGLGHCLRALVAARRGMIPPEFDSKTQLVLDEGTLHEQAILDKLPQYGVVPIEDTQQMVVSLEIDRKTVVRGHIDGLGVYAGGKTIIEAKTMSDAAFKRWRLHRFAEYPAYAWQTSSYSYALNMPVVVVAKNRNNGEIDLFWVEEPPILRSDIHKRVETVEELASRPDNEWPPCDPDELWFCRWVNLHDVKTEARETDTLSLDEQREIGPMLEQFIRARDEAKAAEALAEECRKVIVNFMGDRMDVATGQIKVSRRQVNRTYLDSKAVKKLLSKDQVESVTKTTPTEHLIVTREETK